MSECLQGCPVGVEAFPGMGTHREMFGCPAEIRCDTEIAPGGEGRFVLSLSPLSVSPRGGKMRKFPLRGIFASLRSRATSPRFSPGRNSGFLRRSQSEPCTPSKPQTPLFGTASADTRRGIQTFCYSRASSTALGNFGEVFGSLGKLRKRCEVRALR